MHFAQTVKATGLPEGAGIADLRRTKKRGIIASTAFVLTGVLLAESAGLLPMPAPGLVSTTLLGIAAAAAGCASLLWVSSNGQVYLEWHDQQLWIEVGVPCMGKAAGSRIPASHVQVCNTPPLRQEAK